MDRMMGKEVNRMLRLVRGVFVLGFAIVGGQLAWDAVFLPLNTTLPSQLVPYLSGPSAPQGVNFSGIDNADYTAAVAEASAIAGTDGCEKWAAAEKAIFAHVDLVPFVNSTKAPN